jgi:iron only hydrogenase large subunit-like protein
LSNLKNNKLTQNFFEGMGCVGGCLNGPLSLKHGTKILSTIDKYGEKSNSKDPDSSAKKFSIK